MKAYALLGGPAGQWPTKIATVFHRAQERGALIVGVDRGCLFLKELGLSPNLGIGDFDSLHPREESQIEQVIPDVRYSTPIKDWTDSELMLHAVFHDYHVSALYLFGATGGRLDHFLVNLLTFARPRLRSLAPKVHLIDKQNWIDFYRPGKKIIAAKKAYLYVGLVNLMAVKDLNIIGAKYSLRHFSSMYPRAFASNEFRSGSDNFELTFQKGLVAVIYSRDLNRFANV